MRNTLITSLGIYPKLFELSLPDLQKLVGSLEADSYWTESPMTTFSSACAVFLPSCVEIERRDGNYHVNYLNMDDWHKEGTILSLCPSVIMWSNICPTDFRLPNGEIVNPIPNELVLVENQLVEHKPPNIPENDLPNRRFITIRFTEITPTESQLDLLKAQIEQFK